MILACKAIDPTKYDPDRRAIWESALKAGMETPPDYPDSIAVPCQACQIEVQVGPRQQAALDIENNDALIICLVCVVVFAGENDLEASVISLDNPHGQP